MKTFEDLDDCKTIFVVGNRFSFEDNIEALAMSWALSIQEKRGVQKIGVSNSCPLNPPPFQLSSLDLVLQVSYLIILEKFRRTAPTPDDFMFANVVNYYYR